MKNNLDAFRAPTQRAFVWSVCGLEAFRKPSDQQYFETFWITKVGCEAGRTAALYLAIATCCSVLDLTSQLTVQPSKSPEPTATPPLLHTCSLGVRY
jgi:hypothetical protein